MKKGDMRTEGFFKLTGLKVIIFFALIWFSLFLFSFIAYIWGLLTSFMALTFPISGIVLLVPPLILTIFITYLGSCDIVLNYNRSKNKKRLYIIIGVNLLITLATIIFFFTISPAFF